MHSDVVDNAHRFRNGLPVNATDEDKQKFVPYCVATYKREDYNHEDITKYFNEDFEKFTVEKFKLADAVDFRRLCNFFCDRSVYCPKGLDINIADALFQIIREHPKWPEGDQHEFVFESPNGGNRNTSTNASRLGHDQVVSAAEKNMDNHQTVLHTQPISHQKNILNTYIGKKDFVSNLFPAYSSDADRFISATNDKFRRKFVIFKDRCQQIKLDEFDVSKAIFYADMICTDVLL